MLLADRVCWQLGQVEILRGVSFELNVGEHLAVLGPNGAGKSSLLGLLSADERPSSGTLQFHSPELKISATLFKLSEKTRSELSNLTLPHLKLRSNFDK